MQLALKLDFENEMKRIEQDSFSRIGKDLEIGD